MTELTRGAVKPRPVRIDDGLYDLLAVVASLEGISVTAAITQAIQDYVRRKRTEGGLGEKANQALEEIDREAAARRALIQTLVGDSSEKPAGQKKAGEPSPEAATSADETARRRRPAGFTARWAA